MAAPNHGSNSNNNLTPAAAAGRDGPGSGGPPPAVSYESTVNHQAAAAAAPRRQESHLSAPRPRPQSMPSANSIATNTSTSGNISRNTSIRLRRLPSFQPIEQTRPRRTSEDSTDQNTNSGPVNSLRRVISRTKDKASDVVGRRRSASSPQRPSADLTRTGSHGQGLARSATADNQPDHMASVREEREPRSDATTPAVTPGLDPPVGGAMYAPIQVGQDGAAAAAQHPSDPTSPTRAGAGSRSGTPSSPTRPRPPRQPTANRRSFLRGFSSSNVNAPPQQPEYESEVVDLLDVVDPEVSTLSTLTNVQNSLFIPDLGPFGRFINRQPTYDFPRYRDSALYERPERHTAPTPQPIMEHPDLEAKEHVAGRDFAAVGGADEEESAARRVQFRHADEEEEDDMEVGRKISDIEFSHVQRRRESITSDMQAEVYAVLPHGVTLKGWSDEDKDEINDYVRHLLHSKREGFKRSMRGFKAYVKKPLGLFVTIYAFLITVFGLIWVLFLIGWISGGSAPRHKYLINVIDNVLVALFALVGDGMIPFRTVDTYHMIWIANYAHKTWELREKKGMGKLHNHNDLPSVRADQQIAENPDLEAGMTEAEILQRQTELGPSTSRATVNDDDASVVVMEKSADSGHVTEKSVLTWKQQQRLEHHQQKFAKSHTFYKPHETATHRAFSIRLLITIVVLLDFHSIFQVALGTCTWAINYHTRPEALTTVILICSITCNITAGVLISIGDKRTRKKEVIERMFRQDLTEQAIRHVEKRKEKQSMELTRSEENGGALGAVTAAAKSRKSLDVFRKSTDGRKSMEAGHRKAPLSHGDGTTRSKPGRSGSSSSSSTSSSASSEHAMGLAGQSGSGEPVAQRVRSQSRDRLSRLSGHSGTGHANGERVERVESRSPGPRAALRESTT